MRGQKSETETRKTAGTKGESASAWRMEIERSLRKGGRAFQDSESRRERACRQIGEEDDWDDFYVGDGPSCEDAGTWCFFSNYLDLSQARI